MAEGACGVFVGIDDTKPLSFDNCKASFLEPQIHFLVFARIALRDYIPSHLNVIFCH